MEILILESPFRIRFVSIRPLEVTAHLHCRFGGLSATLYPQAEFQLCLALARTEVPTARGLMHELKLDGYRVQAHVRNGRVTRRWRV
jgi:hypothetical protein